MIYSKQEDCLRVKVDGGYLYATISGDIDYPGICVEFVGDNESDDDLSRPTVLFEKPIGEELRALVWDNKDDEDYTTEIIFN